MGRVAGDALERWWTKVGRGGDDDCWPWVAARFDKGYGAFKVGEKQVKAHRFGYANLIGPIPDGLYVCHRCDNPPCCNPAHWFLGSHRDNAHDREQKGRGRYGTIGPIQQVSRPRRRGVSHPNAVLNPDLVRSIRERYADGESQQAIADSLGVAQRTISMVVRRTTWDHVG